MPVESFWDQLAYDIVYFAVLYGLQPFVAFIKADNFLYWPYLLSFLAIAALLRWRRPDSVKDAFSARVWWSRSARADYLYYLVNGMLYPALLGGVLFSVSSLGGEAAQWLSATFGKAPDWSLSQSTIFLGYTLIYFLLYDFGRFLAHWIQHKNALLWQFHQVHHSAESLTPITSFRVHPVDLIVMTCGEVLFASVAYAIFSWAFPGQFGFYLFLSSHVLLLAYRFLGNLRHSHVWLSYGPLSRIFVSPAMHQIHHSTLPQHRDRNMGFALSIWDQLFGTAYIPKSRERFPMGLGDGQDDGSWHSVLRMYAKPFVTSVHLLKPKSRKKQP